jgi:hypothetical protein
MSKTTTAQNFMSKTITTQLHALMALPETSTHHVAGKTYRVRGKDYRTSGTVYTILGNTPFRKITPVKAYDNTPPPRSPYSQALELYGTEHKAAETIARHLETLGDSLDDGTRKRAEKFLATLQRGHTIMTQRAYTTEFRRKKLVRIYTDEVTGYEASMPFAETAAAELGKLTRWYGHSQTLFMTAEDLAKLTEKFILTIL